MSLYNIFDMRSGEELGRYFARTALEAADAMARAAGFASFDAACERHPAVRDDLLITEL